MSDHETVVDHSEQETAEEQGFFVSRETLRIAIAEVRANLRGSESYAREASARGLNNGAGRTADEASKTMKQNAMGAIDLLGTLFDASEVAPGCVNWLEVVERSRRRRSCRLFLAYSQ